MPVSVCVSVCVLSAVYPRVKAGRLHASFPFLLLKGPHVNICFELATVLLSRQRAAEVAFQFKIQLLLLYPVYCTLPPTPEKHMFYCLFGLIQSFQTVAAASVNFGGFRENCFGAREC